MLRRVFSDPRLESLFERLLSLADRRITCVAALLLTAVLVLLPGQTALPVTDRDEARYVIASRQMLLTGDFIDIRNQEDPRWKKPVGIYWLQAASAAAAGGPQAAGIRAYRLPSLLGMTAAGLLTVWAFAPVAGRRPAFLAGLFVLTSVLAVVEGHIAKTDAVLLACVIATQGALLRIALDRERRGFDAVRGVFWLALAAGTLVKGPLIWLAIVAPLFWLTIFGRDWRLALRLGPWPGPALFLALTLPWFVAIGFRTDWAFYGESLGRDLFGKVGTGQESHGAPPGFYLATIWVTFWPWAALALAGLPTAWRGRHTLAMRFAAGAIIPFWLVFALSATKLVHYMLPVFPALALIAATWLSDPAPERSPRWLRWASAALMLVPGLALAVAAAVLPIAVEGRIAPLAALLATISAVFALAAAALLARGRPRASVITALPAAVLLTPTVVTLTLPATERLFPSPRMAEVHAAWDICAGRPLVSVGYHEPSLVVAAGADTRLASADEAANLLAGGDGWRVFLDIGRESLAEFSARVGVELESLAVLPAINYNGGGATIIDLVARSGDPAFEDCTPDPF